MDSNTFLILGSNGQLGLALQRKYPHAKTADIEELDITNRDSLESFDWTHTKVILNAAAYTNVDGAETTEGRIAAWKVNADAVANLVAVAAQKDLTIVHISTDYVFDGTEKEHSEDESFSPLSAYGASKAAGDIAISLLPKFYILRTSWVIGDGKNFVRTMLELGKKGTSPTVVSDQIGRLTFTSELVRAIDHLLTQSAAFGVYNVTNSGEPASWADITREIFRLAGYDHLTVKHISTHDYFIDKPKAAPRPLNSTLLLDRITATGFRATNWKNDLEQFVKKELQQ